MKTRVLSSIMLTVIMGCVLIPFQSKAQSSSISGNIDVIVNVSQDEMQPYVTAFEKKYPDVNVSLEYCSDYENDIRKRIDSGAYGDVLFVPAYLSKDEYSSYFDRFGSFEKLSEKYRYLDQGKTVGDDVYGMPSSAYITGIVYNRKVFDEAGITQQPTTSREFLQDLRQISDRTDAIPFYTNYADSWALQYWNVFPYIEMTGDAGNKFDSFIYEKNPFGKGSSHYQVDQLLYDIVKNGLAGDNPEKTNWNDSKALLNQGKIGCMVTGSWAVIQFLKAGDNAGDIGFMPYPNAVDGRQYVTLSADYCYGISSKSKNPDAARAFITFMLDESGYALDHENLSICKTDPMPDFYSNMQNVTIMSPKQASDREYQIYKTLSAGFNPEDTSEIQRIIRAADGSEGISFDDIMAEWNKKWESSRTADMKADDNAAMAADQLWQGNQVQKDNYDVQLSLSEKAYVQGKRKVNVGYVSQMAPYSYESKGAAAGAAIEILNVIAEQTGLTLEYIPYHTEADLEEAVARGTVDMAACIEDTDTDLILSRSFFTGTPAIVYNNRFAAENISSNAEAVIRGSSLNFLSQKHRKISVDSCSDAIRAVREGKVQYCVMDSYEASYYLRRNGISGLTMEPLTSQYGMVFAYSGQTDNRLVSICNKYIYSMNDADIQMRVLNHLNSVAETITLKRFIESNPVTSILVIILIAGVLVVLTLIALISSIRTARTKELAAKRYEKLAELSEEYLFEYSYETHLLKFDSKFRDSFGVGQEMHIEAGMVQNENEELRHFIQKTIDCMNDGKNTSDLIPYEHNGVKEWYRAVISRIYDQDGKRPIQIIGKLVSAESEIREQEKLRRKAETDELTGLMNRAGFEAAYNGICKDIPDSSCVYAMLDLDNFKMVNDTLGHQGGDNALCFIADQLKTLYGKYDIAGRMGGDEFVLFAANVTSDGVEKMMERLLSQMHTRLGNDMGEIQITVSIGAFYSMHRVPLEDGIRRADEALYEKKRAGKDGILIRTESESRATDETDKML